MATTAELVERLPEHERAHVMELAENALFMRGKLEETRRGLESQAVVIPYDNGGGQAGIRANPAFTEYEKLLRCYTATLSDLRGILGAVQPKKQAKQVSVVGSSKFAGRMAANG